MLCLQWVCYPILIFFCLSNVSTRGNRHFWIIIDVVRFKYIYTYRISHYTPSTKITNRITILCALILYISGGTNSLRLTPNGGLFEKLLLTLLFTLRVFPRKLLRERCLTWGLNRGLMSNKPKLDYGDIIRSVGVRKVNSATNLICKAVVGSVKTWLTEDYHTIDAVSRVIFISKF